MKTLDCPRIQVQDTKGTNFAIQFDHFDVSKEDWIDTFKLILSFIGFDWVTIGKLFNEEDEEE